MSGKKPKERSCYMLPAGNGSLVEVSREVYQEWHRSRRRERYQRERDRKHNLCSLEALSEDALFLLGGNSTGNVTEEAAVRRICVEKLREGLRTLPEADAFLIRLLFWEERTVTDTARICGCSRTTVRKRRDRILKALRAEMQKAGFFFIVH